MYIARLLLKGFKSFGGSYDLKLEPGMTAIVGPNGSGKSNLLDALRWVLGDSHSSKLRITKQGGLIFHGSSSRPPASEAEVSIQMREETRICTIKRKVSEAGGVVMVDGSRVTLAELEEEKRRWQLGGDRFAFIGQGDVVEVIQQRPSARRQLLESLFGIDEYRKRRQEAADRLGETREEYGRLRTFSAELASRRDEIANEVARASAAREIMDSLEEDRRLLYWVRRARCELGLSKVSGELAALSAILDTKEAWRSRWERGLAYLEGNIAELSQTRQTQVRELEEAKNSLSNFTRTAYGYGAALTSALRRASQIEEEREALAGKLGTLRSEREKSNAEAVCVRHEVERAKHELADAEERYRKQREAASEAREARERTNRERGEIEGEMSTLKGRMKSIGVALRELRGIDAKNDGASPEADPLREIKREMDALEKRHSKLLDEQAAIASVHRDAYAKLQEVSAELQRARRESSRLTNRLAELQDQAATEVYPRPVQHILSAARLGRLEARPCAVIDAFTCPADLATAMEAFLGNRQFWVLLDTMDEAGACIEALKKNAVGRATFLPLERSRPRRRESSYKLPGEGVVGWVMDLIKTETHWRSGIEHLMGDLLVVEDYRVGQALVRGGFRGPVTTLDGDVFQPAGTISGGRAQKSGKAIEIKSALARMEAEADTARQTVDSLTAQFARLEEEESSASSRRESISAEIRELSSKRSELDSSREGIIRDRARVKNERETMIESLREGARTYAGLVRRKRALSAQANVEAEEADIELFKEMERLRSSADLAAEKQRSAFVLSERMTAELRTAEKSAANLDEELSGREQEALTNRSNLRRLSARHAEVAARKRAISAEMADFSERHEKIALRLDRRRLRLDAAKSASQAAALDVNANGTRSAELSRERTELMQTWEEQYPYPGPDAAGDADPDELRRNIRERDRNLRALGDVDMGVLSEDRNLRDRLAFLGDQLDDVNKSMMELGHLISDADEQAKTVFTGALEEIDEKFNDLFKRLFSGGEAKLEMIEGDSLWDSGVDVVARPPGKHPTGINQLSGGEQSLSAIALLFASLEVAQCPIAVLDEVDAALDEVNLRRFADLARDASKKRQILVMTHRRVTMERAGVLYGVTLAEPGLSQVIGVRVEDWA
ncbi:MAG: chromosome segregation protein SMC [Synergistaceae bacterium]|nr:chromosome segregation protein SMC [Synergistaceae bacterium]